MSNRQIHNLTSISNSIDSADLFVVVDRSKLTTNTISLGKLSDALSGTTFLSSSYSLTSSFTEGTTPSCSMSDIVVTSSYTHALSGSNSFAWSSSYSFTSNHCYTNADLFEITSSDDTLNIYTIPNAGGVISIKPRSPFANSYVLKPTSHADVIGSRIISSTSGIITYNGLPARSYEFEVSKLDSSEKVLKFGVTLNYNVPTVTRYSEFLYFSSGGAQFSSGSGVFAISSSFSTTTLYSEQIGSAASASTAIFVLNSSGSGTFSISSSVSRTSHFSENSELSTTSSNGPLPGMILLYAGIRVTGSSAWYDCNGRDYSTAYTELSSSLQNKFSDGVVSNRLPKISSNLYSGSGPFNRQSYISQSIFGHPTNNEISKSYGTGTIIGSYPEEVVYGSNMGPSGSAFYYNIKR